MNQLVACSKKTEIVFDIETKPDSSEGVNEILFEDDDKEIYQEIAFGNVEKPEDTFYDLDTRIEELADIEFVGDYNKNSTFVKCRISAPDVYTYITDNFDSLINMDSESLYNEIVGYIKDEKCPIRNVEVELSAVYDNNQLVVDTTSFEYQDAIHGGLNSALTEFYIQGISEIEDSLGE